MNARNFRLGLILAVAGFCLGSFLAELPAEDPVDSLVLVVMDPLAAPLACDCVKGYAQRQYEKLGEYLTRRLERPVRVVWGGGLKLALEESKGRADLIIGKHSVVLQDAKQAQMEVTPVAALTGSDGSTTQTGLIVVRAADRAQSISDLKGYRIFFGTPDAEEKSAAIISALRAAAIEIPAEPETFEACSGAATQLLELDSKIDAAAVISSYAQPLLEGCGTIQKGDLRVVAESGPVPFISAFVNRQLPSATRDAIQTALLEVAREPQLLLALESKRGFVPLKSENPATTEPEPANPVAKKKK